MDRSDAATTLLLWQFEGQADLVRSVSGDGERTLQALVEGAARERPWHRPRVRPASPEIGFLRLQEERAIEALRERLYAITPFLLADERERLEGRLAPDLMPEGQVLALRLELDRIDGRALRDALQRDLEVRVSEAPARTPPARRPTPGTPLRAILLFARDGRLLASEGDSGGLDLPALADLVSRGEAGSTWRLPHRGLVLVGHVGTQVGLVAVFPMRPKPTVGGALRVALRSLEERDRLVNALTHPGSHTTLMAYVRAVRSLVSRNA